MNNNEFLLTLLQNISIGHKSGIKIELSSELSFIRDNLVKSFGSATLQCAPAGSFAKSTLILPSYDLDMSVSFIHDDTSAGETLEEIRDNVQEALEGIYFVQQKKSCLRLTSRIDGSLHFPVDVVPCRYVDDSQTDVFLFQEGVVKERLKTNFSAQVSHVLESGCAELIKLVKYWKYILGLEVKTFILELLVIELLQDKSNYPLSDQLSAVLEGFRDDLDTVKIEDPANPTGNDLSDLFDDSVRSSLSAAAAISLGILEDEGWEGIFNVSPDQSIPIYGGDSKGCLELILDDFSHASLPPWKNCPKLLDASIKAVVYPKRGKRFEIGNDSHPIREDCLIKYSASTNVPPPFSIYWQVVNTGKHARDENCLRGTRFFPGRNREMNEVGGTSNWETSKFSGKHWIECFVVKDNVLWARSQPFYVNIVNMNKPKIPWRKFRRRR